jgi:phosphate transport system substrate-binding protein
MLQNSRPPVLALIVSVFLFGTPARADTISVGGTGAVTEFLRLVAPAYERSFPQDKVNIIPGLGSSGGIGALTAGAIDLAVTGRELNAKELAAGLTAKPMLETPFVFIGAVGERLAFTRQEIQKIYSGELRSYPSGRAIRVILRPRGDAQNLLLMTLSADMPAVLEKARQRPELPVAGNDQDNMATAKSMVGAFSAFPLLQLRTEHNTFSIAQLDGVDPDLSTMKSGLYTFKLQVSWVLRGQTGAGAKRFLDFIHGPAGQALAEQYGASMFPAP